MSEAVANRNVVALKVNRVEEVQKELLLIRNTLQQIDYAVRKRLYTENDNKLLIKLNPGNIEAVSKLTPRRLDYEKIHNYRMLLERLYTDMTSINKTTGATEE